MPCPYECAEIRSVVLRLITFAQTAFVSYGRSVIAPS